MGVGVDLQERPAVLLDRVGKVAVRNLAGKELGVHGVARGEVELARPAAMSHTWLTLRRNSKEISSLFMPL